MARVSARTVPHSAALRRHAKLTKKGDDMIGGARDCTSANAIRCTAGIK
jgi:hypothetical protein